MQKRKSRLYTLWSIKVQLLLLWQWFLHNIDVNSVIISYHIDHHIMMIDIAGIYIWEIIFSLLNYPRLRFKRFCQLTDAVYCIVLYELRSANAILHHWNIISTSPAKHSISTCHATSNVSLTHHYWLAAQRDTCTRDWWGRLEQPML